MGRGQASAEKQVKSILAFADVCKMYQDKIDKLESKLGKVRAYVQLLQNGDPDNENPKKILDTIDADIGVNDD